MIREQFKFTNKADDKTGQEFYKFANQLYKFAEKRLQFDKPASCVLIDDPKNASNPLGYTAYYDPKKAVVTVYSTGRHIKDMLRSFAHELVHHAQAVRGDLQNMNTPEGYAQTDSHMREMEREAYEQGNLIFRDWEDGVKSKSKNLVKEAGGDELNQLEEAELKYDTKAYTEMSNYLTACFCDSLIQQNLNLYRFSKDFFQKNDIKADEAATQVFENFFDDSTFGSVWPNVESTLEHIKTDPKSVKKERNGFVHAFNGNLPIIDESVDVFIKVNSKDSYDWEIHVDNEPIYESEESLTFSQFKSQLKEFLERTFEFFGVDALIFNAKHLFTFLKKYEDIAKSVDKGVKLILNKAYKKKFDIKLEDHREDLILSLYPDAVQAYQDYPDVEQNYKGFFTLSKTYQMYMIVLILDTKITDEYVNLEDNYRDNLRTLRHEMQHAQQVLIKNKFKLKNMAGLPDTRPQHKDYSINLSKGSINWSKPHSLRSIEYKPRLSDEIDRFKYSIKYILSDPRAPVEQKVSEIKKRIRNWTGTAQPDAFGVDSTQFFQSLKKNKPSWYKKAVNEFTTEIVRYVDEILSGTMQEEKNVTDLTSKKYDPRVDQHHRLDVLSHNQVYDMSSTPYYHKFEENLQLQERIFDKKLTFEKIIEIIYGNPILTSLENLKPEDDLDEFSNQFSSSQWLNYFEPVYQRGVPGWYWNGATTFKKLEKFLDREQIKQLLQIIDKSVNETSKLKDNLTDHSPSWRRADGAWSAPYIHGMFIRFLRKNIEASEFWENYNYRTSSQLWYGKFSPERKGDLLFLHAKDEEIELFVHLKKYFIGSLMFEPELNEKIPFYWTGETWSIKPSNAKKLDKNELKQTLANWNSNHLLIPTTNSLENFPLHENLQRPVISDEFKQEVLSYLDLEHPEESGKNWIGTATWDGGEISFFWVQRKNLFYLVEFSPSYGVDIKNVFSTWFEVNSAGLRQLNRNTNNTNVVTFKDLKRR